MIGDKITARLEDIDFSGMTLPMWTVYDHPKDYPDKIVARLWEGALNLPTNAVILFDSLEAVRALFEPRYARLTRSPGDDAKIMETYL